MKNKNTWLITDTHLGHANMVKYCGRPENHSDIILEELSNNIKEGDTVIHLGDVCFGDDSFWNYKMMMRIPDTKRILLRGNHDKKSNKWYLEHGWDFVCETYSDHFEGKYITFSHEPIANIQNLNIHGHFHNNLDRLKREDWVVDGEEERNKEVLAGMNDNHKLFAIEHTEYKPVLLRTFIKT